MTSLEDRSKILVETFQDLLIKSLGNISGLSRGYYDSFVVTTIKDIFAGETIGIYFYLYKIRCPLSMDVVVRQGDQDVKIPTFRVEEDLAKIFVDLLNTFPRTEPKEKEWYLRNEPVKIPEPNDCATPKFLLTFSGGKFSDLREVVRMPS